MSGLASRAQVVKLANDLGLLGEPKLAKPVPPRFLQTRDLIDVGQRFYYLEILEPQVRRPAAPGSVPPRVSQTNVVIDFPGSQVRIVPYYSESEAQAIAALIRSRSTSRNPREVAVGLISALRAGLDVRLQTILSGEPNRRVRLIHEAVPTDHLLPQAAAAVRVVAPYLRQVAITWVLKALQKEIEGRWERFTTDLVKTADAATDGLTVCLVYQRPSVLQSLGAALGRLAGPAGTAIAGGVGATAMGSVAVEVRPGFARW